MKITQLQPQTDSSVQAVTQARSSSKREQAIAKFNEVSSLRSQQNAAQVQETPAEVMLAQGRANTEKAIEEKAALDSELLATDSVEGQTDNVEATAEVTAPKEETKAQEEPLSTQYAILARKEKALRAKVQAQEASMKAKEAAMLAREEAIKAKEAEYQTNYIPKSKLADSPWEVLNEAGLTYDQLTEMALTAQQQDPATKAAISRMEQQLKAYEEQANQTKKAQENQQKQAYDQAISQIKSEVKQAVFTNPDFETIKEMGATNDVVDLIEQTFKSDGIILTTEEACREVEEHLVEEAMKISRIKKIQSRLAPKQEAQKQSDQPKQQQPMRTLTNQISQSKKLSVRERAILAFKGEKN